MSDKVIISYFAVIGIVYVAMVVLAIANHKPL